MSDQERIETRGRPKGLPKDDIHVKVDSDLALYFRMKFADSFTGKTMKKGALSDLINRLLRAEYDREMALTKEMQK